MSSAPCPARPPPPVARRLQPAAQFELVRRTRTIVHIKMASRKLSDSEMTHLVELYRENEVLWKVTHKSYRSREARDNAYARIRDSLNTPSLSLQDISKKIKKLRSTYIKERKKIDASFRSGASTQSVYKPKMPWFEIADGFLRTYTSKRHTNTNMVSKFINLN